jgi:hypothetical protein
MDRALAAPAPKPHSTVSLEGDGPHKMRAA